MNHQETMTDYLMAFIEGLKNSGVEQAVISPGSRSTPLALFFIGKPQSKLLSMSMNVPLLFLL